MKKILKWLGLGFIGLIMVSCIAAVAGGGDEPAGDTGEVASETTERDAGGDAGGDRISEEATEEPPTEEEPAEEEPAEEPAPKPEPKLTAGQENAIRTAENYLEFTAFSRKGLIEQLKFEGYSEKDAAFAADHLKPNYNEQAAKKAQEYLDTQGFSRSGLIEQLEFEGYTKKQAIYGVNKAGL